MKADFIDGALSWLLAHMDLFAPAAWTGRGGFEESFPEGRTLELLLVARAATEQGVQHPALAAAADHAVALWNDPARWARMDAHTADLRYHLIYLGLLGSLREVSDTDIRRSRDAARYLYAPEGADATDMAELRLARECAGLAGPAPTGLGSSLNSAEDRPPLKPHPYDYTKPDAYNLTHWVFFASRFGAKPLEIQTHRERASLVETLDYLLWVAWRTSDWDLTSELILSLAMVNSNVAGGGGFAPDAWDAIERAQQPDGSILGPGHDRSRDVSREAIFSTCAHTTIVAVLCALRAWDGPHGTSPAGEDGSTPPCPCHASGDPARHATSPDLGCPGPDHCPRQRARMATTKALAAGRRGDTDSVERLRRQVGQTMQPHPGTDADPAFDPAGYLRPTTPTTKAGDRP